MTEPIRRSPVSQQTARLGARVSVEAGWEIVRGYEREASLGEHVGVVDVTPRAKVDVRGDLRSLGSPDGTFVGRLSPDRALVLARPGGETELLPALEAAMGLRTMVTDATHLLCGFVLAGPRTMDLLERATSWDASSLGFDEMLAAPIVGIPAIVARRDGARPLFELYVGSEFGRYAWEQLIGLAMELGGGPAGWDALVAEGWS